MNKNLNVINDWIIVLDEAILPELCDELIQHSKDHLKSSGILGNQIENYRTSSDYFFETATELTKSIDEIVADFSSLAFENQEGLSIIKYSVGQEYKEHYDFLHHLEEETQRGGDRLFTAIFYLNDNFVGGETYFPKLDIAVLPKKGRMLIWKNYIKGLPNYDSLHCGLPVTEGEKWIGSKWVREFAFT